MNHDEKARDYAARLKALLDEAREDGFVFAVSGGRRTAYKLTVTVLPQTFELDELNQNQGD
jgi:NH3-dependent NAD+ synthetase